MRTSTEIKEAIAPIVLIHDEIALYKEYLKDLKSFTENEKCECLTYYKVLNSKWIFAINELQKDFKDPWINQNYIRDLISSMMVHEKSKVNDRTWYEMKRLYKSILNWDIEKIAQNKEICIAVKSVIDKIKFENSYE